MAASGSARALSVLHVMEATIGGTRRHLVDVAKNQRRLGLTVAVAASAERTRDFRADLAELQLDGVRVEEIPMVRSMAPVSDMRHLARLEQLLCELRPQIVHTHSSKAGVLGRLASMNTGIGARVHTPHTFAFLFRAMFGATKREFFRQLEVSLGAVTDRVVAVSRGEAETIRTAGVVAPERVRVVENGIDAARWVSAKAIAPRELGVPQNAPWIAVAGLLNVAKGQDLALEALADPRLERVHVALVGHGEERAHLEARARALGLAERAHFLGWREDLPEILTAADALLLPSRWEGMPYVVLEAMAAGRAVVATPVDGARDVVLDGLTGILCEEASAAAIARGLVRLYGMPWQQRMRMGANGREVVLARHTAARMASELALVYREVA